MADLGADVVKVESPDGDETRQWGPPDVGGLSAYFLACNRGKRSIVLDLKSEPDRRQFLALAQRADVILVNFLPDVGKRLGVDPAALQVANPRAIVIHMTGYGTGHSRSHQPGYDFVIQGMSGMMAMTGPEGGAPHKFGVAIADLVTGQYAAIAALAALRRRETTGKGCVVDLALIDCAAATMANVAQAYLVTRQVPRRQGNAHLQIVPYQVFQTADKPFVLAVGNDRQWRQFCAVAGAADLAADPRFNTNPGRVAARAELTAKLSAVMAARDAADWEQALSAAGVPCGPVWGFDELFGSKLAMARVLTVKATLADGTTVDLLNSPLVDLTGAVAAPPRLGQHSEEVIKEWLR
jgi:crotonobetainyl-CoA:carnitine CoA-transferase CaiB-like acyl-CoA transferase